MKKIISILLALGVVLSLTVMATPVAADVSEPQVVVDPDCACDTAAYNITFNITASLTEGVTCVCIEFPEGTTVPTEFATGDISIEGVDVFGSEVIVDGNVVCFLTPMDILATASPILVEFDDDADIVNPCVAGDYTLFVWTCRAPDATPVESAKYLIVPAISEYAYVFDFGPTYPGIAEGFVPPFKACGQEDYGVLNGTRWDTVFNLTFASIVVGCAPPCAEADIWFELHACPEAEVITMSIDGEWFTLDADDMVDPLTLEYIEYEIAGGKMTLTTAMAVTWDSTLHFSSPGDYEICFYAECPAIACGAGSALIVDQCVPFTAHQWKDAGKIFIDEKWNLISLPLVPFDTDIDALLASFAGVDDLISIWHYDRCADAWFVYGNGQSSLTDMEDGKSYWLRMDYPMAGNYTWWVWGTEKPMPPASPAEYPLCLGWNMFGFTSLTDMDVNLYLWNWTTVKPVVYGWTQGEWTVQGWNMIDWAGPDNLVSGQGYWGAFPANGAIYVP